MELDRKILEGIYDVHVHAGPSLADRSVDVVDMFKEAEAAGYAGFVVKDHYYPNLFGTQMVNTHLGTGKTTAYGCLVLNNSVGGFNVNAVDKARQLGTAMVYFPTVSSKTHIDNHKGAGFVGGANASVEEEPLVIADADGEMNPKAVEVIEYMAEHDMVLGTGHGNQIEVDATVKTAFEKGMKRVLVTHPHYQVGATIEDMVRWRDLGAYIEINACVFKDVGSVVENVTELSYAQEMIDTIGIDRIIIDTDYGQAKNDTPVEGMYNFLNALHEQFGYTEEELSIMTKKNPKELFGFN